ncbi:hypothetical protein J6590_020229 [Homalodisca vitripennis]|nr:hypothetical protein J6590_020229 [Homalodisca vitripennis]
MRKWSEVEWCPQDMHRPPVTRGGGGIKIAARGKGRASFSLRFLTLRFSLPYNTRLFSVAGAGGKILRCVVEGRDAGAENCKENIVSTVWVEGIRENERGFSKRERERKNGRRRADRLPVSFTSFLPLGWKARRRHDAQLSHRRDATRRAAPSPRLTPHVFGFFTPPIFIIPPDTSGAQSCAVSRRACLKKRKLGADRPKERTVSAIVPWAAGRDSDHVPPAFCPPETRTISTTISTPLDLRASPGEGPGEDSPMSADIQQPVLIQRPVFKMNPAADFWHQARGPPPISPTDSLNSNNNNNNNTSSNNNNSISTPPPMQPQSLLQHAQQQMQQHQQHQQQMHHQQQQQSQQQQQAQQQPQQPQQPQLQSPNEGHSTPNNSSTAPAGPGTPEPPSDGLHSPVGGPSNALALVGDNKMMNDKLVNEFQGCRPAIEGCRARFVPRATLQHNKQIINRL